MKALLLALALVASPAVPQTAPPVQHSGLLRDPTSFSEIIPPERYQGNTIAVVIFTDREGIANLCGAGNGKTRPLACTAVRNGVAVMAVPNPCLNPDNLYAAVLCHEKGHAAGWPGTHGD